ncbi:MAG: long-chain-fatty-acid--CoA ligase [Chloroflexi bacterium]|nr:long-chain-fatty-acid--CoA ligase [Chloroflexota bacterium]
MRTFGELLDARARETPDKVALYHYDDQFTCREWNERANQVGNALIALGVKPGDVVCQLLPNSATFLFNLFGTAKVGAALSPLNIMFRGEEIKYQINDCGAVVLFTSKEFLPVVAPIRDQLKTLRHIILIDGEAPGYLTYDDFLAKGSIDTPEVQVDPLDTVLMIYTSGTTGFPKGVMLTHKAFLADSRQFAQAMKLTSDDRAMLILPLFHVNGLMVTTVAPLLVGGSIVVRQKFVQEEFWPAIEQYRPTYFSAVPTIYFRLLNDPAGSKADVSSLRCGVCGAAPMPVEVFRQFEEKFDLKIIEGYGLTEGSCCSTVNPIDGERKIGSIGFPLPGQEVKIVDDDDNELPSGQVGEIVIRGDNLMKGYFGKPEATAETIKNGWLHSGDVGFTDNEGYIYIVDRKKDMIIRGGENIYPKEVENFLYTHPKVLEAAVIGVPDAALGEQVKACIALKPGETASAEEIIDFCKQGMARYKAPKYVEFFESLPKNAVGKITKPALRDMALKRSN